MFHLIFIIGLYILIWKIKYILFRNICSIFQNIMNLFKLFYVSLYRT